MANQSMSFDDIIRKLSADDNASDDDCDNKGEIIDKNTYRTIVSCIISLPPKQYTLLSSLIGILLIEHLDPIEQISLGKFINNIGQTIITSAAQEQLSIKKDKI